MLLSMRLLYRAPRRDQFCDAKLLDAAGGPIGHVHVGI